ncbi:efflux RND transporter periplasmic adaptor subunit [Falsihalocynthiibacter sp. SS001]|uniref:efflux RND transporter periplasmic adaptor subunit n=1 Tax=Falsihalocynthiibacter sp. SS001 TaxID=3349698 RepID=UPI0036D3E2AF
MRLLPILTAILVSAFLFFLVFQRDNLVDFARETDAPPSEAETAAAPEPDNTTPSKPLVSVVALRSVAQPIENAVLLRGETEAAREVEVRSEVSGLIISEPLRKGSQVEKDQLLCEVEIGTRASDLEDAQGVLIRAQAAVPEANARLAEANARLAEAQINDNAAKRLSEGGFASDTRVASAAASVESALAAVEAAKAAASAATSGIKSAEARVAAAQREIDRLKINAPFAGMLETDTAELGTLMQPGALCGTVVLLNPIKLVGFVPETDVERIKVGAMAGARLASGREARGSVSFLSRTADVTTRTFRVEVIVPNEDLAIRDGQTVEIIVSAAGTEAHLVPASALTLDDDGELGVRTVDENKTVQFAPVSILRDEIGGVWLDGLPDEVSIITSGQEYVTDGVTVAVTYKEPS